jgi:uncharacterized membrane protein
MNWRRVLSVGLRVVFVLSLLMNAAAIGVWMRVHSLRDTLNGGSSGLAGLPREVRSELRGAMRSHRGEFVSALDRLGAARKAMFAAANARPYDAAKVEAAMADVRVATTALQEEGQKLLAEALASAAGK